MTVEAPRMSQQTPSGTESSRSTKLSLGDKTGAFGEVVSTGGALWIVTAGTVFCNGCVFDIFTVGCGAARSGRILIRAVSFFGPDCVPEPG